MHCILGVPVILSTPVVAFHKSLRFHTFLLHMNIQTLTLNSFFSFGQMCLEDTYIISGFLRVIHTHHREQNSFHLEAHGLLNLPCLAVGSREENH